MEESENLQTADSSPTTEEPTEPVVADAQSPVESPTTEPPKKSKPTFLEHKYVIIALAVLVIAILGATVFLFFQNQSLKKEMSQSPLATPTPDPTASQAPNGDLADWETYSNEKHGFSIKYPPTIAINKEASDEDIVAFYLISNGQVPGEKKLEEDISVLINSNLFYFAILVSNTSQGLLLSCFEKTVETKTLEGLPEKTLTMSYKNVEVAGYTACKDESLDEDGVFINTMFEKEENVYTFQILAAKDGDFYKEVYNQILSTFEFLED